MDNKVLIVYICEELFKINNEVLISPKTIKLRKSVFNIIGNCFMDNYNDDFVTNSVIITQKIINTNRHQNGYYIDRMLYDIIGIYQQTYISKIMITFTKVCYP